jgi:hypothetical protein
MRGPNKQDAAARIISFPGQPFFASWYGFGQFHAA